MSPLDKYRESNRDNWDACVPVHLNSYPVEEFTSDPEYMTPTVRLALEGLRDVDFKGKSLLHLQCLFGLDTLSFARLGAVVTGIDLSPLAIEAAHALSNESKVSGRFIETELYDAPSALDEQFDLVYTGAGALLWLPDISPATSDWQIDSFFDVSYSIVRDRDFGELSTVDIELIALSLRSADPVEVLDRVDAALTKALGDKKHKHKGHVTILK